MALTTLFAVGGLAVVSQPFQQSRRLADLGRARMEISRLHSSSLNAPRGAHIQLCRGAAGFEGASVKARMTRMLAPLTVEAVGLGSIPQALPNSGLLSYSVALSAKGPYPSAAEALARLAELKPTIFVDALDLKRSDDGVILDLRGRFLCLNAAS